LQIKKRGIRRLPLLARLPLPVIHMKQLIVANKGGLYTKLLVRLAETYTEHHSSKSYMAFPIVFGKVCRNFSITKGEAWEIFRILQELGFVTIIPFKGIKIHYVVKNGRNNK
jgi:hypothetical protein